MSQPAQPPSMPEKELWYKRRWVIALVSFVLGGALGTGLGETDKQTAEPQPTVTITMATTATATATATATVTETAAPEPSETPSAKETQDEGNKRVSESAAVALCQQYGDKAFPYGFKIHTLTGRIAERHLSDGRFFMKNVVTVTNQYGAKQEAEMECYVKGEGRDVEISDFIVQ